MNFNKKIIPLILATTIFQSLTPSTVFADSNIDPVKAEYGYFIDNWNNNNTNNMNTDVNPAIGCLSQFLKIFTPGNSWNNGIILNQEVHEHNIDTVIEMTKDNIMNNSSLSDNTTDAAAKVNMDKFTHGSLAQVYLDDRRDQNYSITDGLGKYTDVFRKLANAGTTIKGVAEDSTTKSYIDKGNNNGVWADEDSQLGGIVKLINTIRNSSASTTPSKNYYQYMRPFRWSDDVNVLPTLIPVIKPEEKASSDGGFPSGHTNAAYLSSLGLAYAVPERFQEIITRASELGNDRIKAGMHSPLDVMGGRTMATAIAAAALNNKDNSDIKAEAYKEAHEKLLTQEGSSIDRFDNYEENKKNYTERLTYGFNKIGNSTKPMVVPKGAEVLLETRLPYLDSSQRREVLYTTGIESGYPLLDDEEGWGRLNLFAAADGYGAFNGDVTINMDASKGGFNASDSWRNDISGTGSLTKNGTGTLKLTGDNTYSGGTYINEGILEADSSTSLGKGNVTNDGGTFKENVSGTINLNGEYKQSENSTLELSINGNGDLFMINGNASLGGKLKLNFIDNYMPDNNMTIIKFKSNNESSRFSSLETTGLPTDYKAELIYDNNEIRLLINKSQDNGFSNSTSSHHSSHHSSSSNSDNNNTSADENSSKDNNIVNNNTNTEKEEEFKSGWQQKDGLWYNISENGIKNTGWFKDSDGKWYYLDKSGAMKTGWFKDSNNKWYYLNKSGSMQTGWFKDSDGKWYYLNESGSMHTGWFKDSDGKWYYLNESGSMYTGWFKDLNGKWYYLNESGSMQHDTYIDEYYLNSDGTWAE